MGDSIIDTEHNMIVTEWKKERMD